ncbi:hypothetical protein KF840_13520 [bacterium]|nr:hypothetical protein [bacterium]
MSDLRRAAARVSCQGRSRERCRGRFERVVVAALLLFAPCAAMAVPRGVIPGGREGEIAALAAPLTLGGTVADGYRLAGIRVEGDAFAFVLAADGQAPVEVRFAADGTVESRPAAAALAPAAQAAVARLRASVEPRVDAAFWQRILVAPGASGPRRIETPHPLLTWAVLAAALLAIALLDRRGVATPPSLLLSAVLALVPLVAWSVQWGAPPGGIDPGQLEDWLQQRERHLVQLALAVALVGLLAGVGVLVRRRRLSRAAAIDAGSVLLWSLAVRFRLTAANVLTDGGSGWSRLLEYRRGFSGIAVLVDLVLPDRPMWESIAVPRLVAALSPPLLVLLARALGADRGSAVFAGLALASLPLHAALYSSDFESGAVVSLALAALALVAAARDGLGLLLAAGCALLGYAVWGRPEALVIGLPLLVVAWGVLRRSWARCTVVAALVWLGGLTVVRLASLPQLAHGTRGDLAGPWRVLPLGELLTTSAVLPWWLWLPLPVGLAWLRGRARAACVAGLLAGVVPLHVTPTGFDPTETYLELFRYGSFALPWMALLAGAGLAGVAAVLARGLRRRGAASGAAVVLGLLVAATPLLNRDYLARRYGPAVDEEVFREALTQVPGQCALIVPDDGDARGALEVMKRYVEIARTAPPPAGGASPRLVGLSAFLRDWRDGGAMPDGCWFFYRGSFCHDGFEGTPPADCAALLARAPFEPVWSRAVEYRSHRLVTRPARVAAPWYEPRLELTLYRLRTPS